MTAPYPVDTFKAAAQYLRRPFTPEAVRWKIQASYPKGNGVVDKDGKWMDGSKHQGQFPDGAKSIDPRSAMVVGYIDARLVIERLNLVIPDWSDRYELAQLHGPQEGGSKSLVCHLTVGGITRTDIGKGSGPEALKAAYSDALKRAAVKFGVGVSVYAIPIMKMECGTRGPMQLPVRGPVGKRTARIEAAQQQALADMYKTWLESDKGKQFGDPIDHGDVLDSAGGEPDEHPPEDDEAAATDDDDGTLFPDTAPTKDAKTQGRKINAARAREIGDLFEQSARDPLELAGKLEALGADTTRGNSEAVKSLKAGQADDLEQWLKEPPIPRTAQQAA